MNIPIPTKIGSKIGGATTPKWDPLDLTQKYGRCAFVAIAIFGFQNTKGFRSPALEGKREESNLRTLSLPQKMGSPPGVSLRTLSDWLVIAQIFRGRDQPCLRGPLGDSRYFSQVEKSSIGILVSQQHGSPETGQVSDKENIFWEGTLLAHLLFPGAWRRNSRSSSREVSIRVPFFFCSLF